MGYDKFKNKIFSYYNSFENTKNKLPLLKEALNRIVEYELPSRDDKQLFIVRDFTNSEGIKLNINKNNVLCFYSHEKNRLFVGTLGPYWDSGWRGVSKDPLIQDRINWLFHFANQYIYRSRQINLIGAIALAYGRCCNYMGDFLSFTLPYSNLKYLDFKKQISCNQTRRGRIVLHYLEILNALDPCVNKAIFYYVRALRLKEDGFDEESVTCADNMVDTILQDIKLRLKLPTIQRKDMIQIVADQISIPKTEAESLNSLYQLRCSFSAHPAQSKWWDFSEIYDTDINAIFDSIKTFLVKFCMYERTHCRIEPNPDKWSEWFLMYSDIVFDAVWFHLLPQI